MNKYHPCSLFHILPFIILRIFWDKNFTLQHFPAIFKLTEFPSNLFVSKLLEDDNILKRGTCFKSDRKYVNKCITIQNPWRWSLNIQIVYIQFECGNQLFFLLIWNILTHFIIKVQKCKLILLQKNNNYSII